MFRFSKDRWLLGLLRLSGALAGVLSLLVIAFVLKESLPALQQVGPGRFFTDVGWHPAGPAESARFNLTPMLWGTLSATLGALLLATPLGVLSAVFCQFYAPPRLASAYRRLVELMAGMPSVVIGFWGLVVLVPLIRSLHPPGPSLLAGIVILTLMILPTIALLADAAIAAIPATTLRAAAALGLGRWSTTLQVVLPAARQGLGAGVVLSAGRAIGETMGVLMVCGNLVQTPHSLFDPIRTLTANIALEMAYAMSGHRSALFVSGLVLLALVVALVLLAGSLSGGRKAHG